MKAWIRLHIVTLLEGLCGLLDNYVPGYWDKRLHRQGQWGCRIGIAMWAVKLDDRWSTGHWAHEGTAMKEKP